MQKVLFVATVASHINSFHIPYLKMFKENGYKTFVAANWNLNHKDKIEFCDEFIQIPLKRTPYSLKNIRAILELKKIIDKEKFDIIHCHTPMGSVVTRLAAKSARKKYGIRVIYTAHGFHFFKGAPLKNWILFYPIEWLLSKYTDTIITMNKEDFDIAKKKFHNRCSDIRYVPGVGIDLNKFDFNLSNIKKQNLRKKFELHEDEFVFLSVGELSKRKNHEVIIRALAKIQNPTIKYLIVGKGNLKGYLENLSKKLKVENQVVFCGYRTDIKDLLCAVDAFAFPSKQEGLPVALMEAMATGLPIVGSNIRGNVDLIKNGYGGFLYKYNDVEGFACGMNKIMSTKSDDMKIINKKNIKNYDINVLKEKMKEIYNI